DGRVDFRQLIKVYAETFRVRIEMKQIGARQEAGRIGGIGPCGRPLCCSSWLTKFSSVATSSARYQEISLNPQKLAGQCAKLKCCLNYEVDAYVEAQKDIPPRNIPLETKDATFYHFKTDVFGRIMQYSSAPNMASNVVSIPIERVKEIMALNKQGIKVDSLLEETEDGKPIDYENVVGQDSLTRFDKKKKKKKKNKGNGSAAAQAAADNAEGASASPANEGGNEAPQETTGNAEAKAGNGGQNNAKNNGSQRGDKRQNRDRNNRRPQQQKQQPSPSDGESAPARNEEGGAGDNEGKNNAQPSNQNGNPNRNRNNRRNRNNQRRQNGGNGGGNEGGNNQSSNNSNNVNAKGGDE
ncbi:MAG: hypothetical protein IKZ67_02375, partial [Paludibacteraceae bacterium]|nr:hypothetical protein [Paludibacteraceae bacterium]